MSNTYAPAAPPLPYKETGIAYLFWFFLGAVGGHKFYLGKIGLGVAYLLTLGFLGFGVLYDLFTLPSQVRKHNEEIAHRANLASLAVSTPAIADATA